MGSKFAGSSGEMKTTRFNPQQLSRVEKMMSSIMHESHAETILWAMHIALILYNTPRGDPQCVFRANHASNYLPLRGALPQDRDHLLATLETAIARGGDALRLEAWRGL